MFATGVTVIAAEVKDETLAMTANAVTSVSLDPLLVLVCVGKQARLAGFLDDVTGFSINVLREDQQALSTYFAGGWREPEPPPFRFVPWGTAQRLEGCLAAVACRSYEIVPGGDHWIVVGEVVDTHIGIEPHRPLLFYAGQYGRANTLVRDPAPDLGWVEKPVQVFLDPWQKES